MSRVDRLTYHTYLPGPPLSEFVACFWLAERASQPYLYVDDTDATYKHALQAGASSLMEPADQFYGDRNAGVKDPFGNIWWITTHIENVSPDELQQRADRFMTS